MKGLGSDFSSFSATQMAKSPLPSFSNLLNNAEAWDMFQQTLESNMSSPAAFTAHTYSRSSNNQMSRGRGSSPEKSGRGGFSQKRQLHCQICRTTGHYANVCPDRFNREIGTTTPVANIAEAFSASSIASDPPISDWYLDTGASAHMTPLIYVIRSRMDGLYVLDDTKSALVAARTPKASFELWHSRLGHVAFDLPNVNPDSARQPSSCNLCDEPPLLSGLQSHTNQDEHTINTHEIPTIPHETQSQPNQEEPNIKNQQVNESSLDPIIEPAPQIEMNPLVPPPIKMNPIVPFPRVSSTHPMQTRSRAGNSYDDLKSFISRLHQEFALTDLGKLGYFLGLEVTYTSSGIFLNQAKYARDILQRASLEESKPVSTPLVAVSIFNILPLLIFKR
ncbi:hypothetical protein SASPL_150631 [Salvia splendens]|uniref:Reverse transcriptase Ty1/copia-type domain-containing protein n=1 Tax=Salvia splendens TaxID=180675 RepID=A0A8X8Z1X7_SALSN|nr:hypothetical protein SASPL_150631 [Salvia splendens]